MDTIKIKVEDLVIAQETIEKLGAIEDPSLSSNTVYWMGKALRKLREELRDYYAARDSLVAKHLPKKKKDEEEPRINPGSSEMKAFQAEHKVLLAQEVELPNILFKVDEIPIGSLSLADYANLWWMFEEELTPV